MSFPTTCWIAPRNWTLNHFAFANDMKTLCGITLVKRGQVERPQAEARRGTCAVCHSRATNMEKRR